MRNIIIGLASSVFWTSMIAWPSNAADIQPIAKLIGQRLSHMQNVARYKEAHNIAIEDPAQEARVIQHSLEVAESLGLEASSVKSFIDIQMKAAKAVQYRYLADWLLVDKMPDAPSSLTRERKQIGELGEQLLQLLAMKLKKGERIEPMDKDDFTNSIGSYDLKTNEKAKIFDALRAIKLSHW